MPQTSFVNNGEQMPTALVVTFWVFFSVMILVVLVLVILLIWSSVIIGQNVDAIYGAAFNTNTCDQFPQRCQYIERNPAVPTQFSDEFSPTTALFVAQQVLNLEYLDQTHNLHLPPALTFVGPLKTSEASAPLFGYVALDPVNKIAYQIFRGTETSDEWGFDFKFAQTPFVTQDLVTSSMVNWTCGSDTLVHDGFFDVFQQIQNQVVALTRSVLDQVDRIVVAGHSLGAAGKLLIIFPTKVGINLIVFAKLRFLFLSIKTCLLVSSLVAMFLSSDITDKPVYVYTFGKPRVGNVAYADCVNAHFVRRFWRVENNNDLVPQIPTAATPNTSNYDYPWLYEHEGSEIEFYSNWGSITLNHSMNNYIDYLLLLSRTAS